MAKYSLLEVSGESCANCLTLLPLVNRLAAARGLEVGHLEVNEANAQRVRSLQVDRVPTLIVFRDGKEVARCTGYQPEEILSVWVEAKLEEYNGDRG